MRYVYEAGALIAIDNDDRRMRAVHKQAIAGGISVYVPSRRHCAQSSGRLIRTVSKR